MKTVSLITSLVAATLNFALLMPYEAAAHAILLETAPAPKATISGDSVEIRLRFNERVDANRSRLMLFGPGGATQRLQLQADGPETLVSEASNLDAGIHIAKWQVMAADGHMTHGEFWFSVKRP